MFEIAELPNSLSIDYPYTFNPRLTKPLFCNTSYQGILWQPPMNLKNKRLRYAYFVACNRPGSSLSIHAKKVQTSHLLRHDEVIDIVQIADLQ